MTTTVLITDGLERIGRLGRTVVPQLVDAGHRVRVLTRRKRGPAGWASVVRDRHGIAARIAYERSGR